MAEQVQSTEETPKAEGAPTPPPPKRGLGHRGADPRDTAAELAARAHAISLEAGSKMAGAMRDVIHAAAGISGFVATSARDLVNFMVRRGQVSAEEAEKMIREAEEAYSRRVAEGWEPTGMPPMPEPAPAPAAAPSPAPAVLAADAPPPPAATKTPAPVAEPSRAKAAPAARSAKPAAAPAKPAAKAPAKGATKAAPAKSAAKAPVKGAKPATKPVAKPAAKAPAKSAKPVAKSGSAVKSAAKAAAKSSRPAAKGVAKKAAAKRR